jgi:hypothetical protein
MVADANQKVKAEVEITLKQRAWTGSMLTPELVGMSRFSQPSMRF